MSHTKRFIETIRMENGDCPLFKYHLERLSRTWSAFFSEFPMPDLEEILSAIPIAKGKTKVRIEYGEQGITIDHTVYARKTIRMVSFVFDNALVYDFKFADRSQIENHFSMKNHEHHEIIFVKHKMITDSSIANIVILKNGSYLTPKHPLLSGVCRKYYLERKIIIPCDLTTEDLLGCENIFFINAMNSLEDDWSIFPRLLI